MMKEQWVLKKEQKKDFAIEVDFKFKIFVFNHWNENVLPTSFVTFFQDNDQAKLISKIHYETF